MEASKTWNNKLKEDIKLLEQANNLTQDTLYDLLENYLIENQNNRYVDILPIKYFYENYYSHLIDTNELTIVDYTFKYNKYYPIQDIELRSETRFKLTLFSLFQNNQSLIAELFQVKLTCEFEKYSDVYKEVKDTFIKLINENFNVKIQYNTKYRVHDCLFTMANNDGKYQIACEFNENSHEESYDSNRKVSLKIPLTSLFVRKQGDYEQSMDEYIKIICLEIIYKGCALSSDKKILAKLFIFETVSIDKYNEMANKLTTLLNCLDKDKFMFIDLDALFGFECSDQEELLEILRDNDIINKEDENDDEKISFYIDDDGLYYLDQDAFDKLILLLMGTDICKNHKQVNEIYIKSLKALMNASDRMNKKEKESKIDTQNISSFIHEIAIKVIQEMVDQKYKETQLSGMFKKIFDNLQKRRHCSIGPLTYIKYQEGHNLRESDLWIVKYIFEKNYNRAIKTTIDKYNSNNSKHMILFKKKDDVNNNIAIKNAYIDYAELFNYHFSFKA